MRAKADSLHLMGLSIIPTVLQGLPVKGPDRSIALPPPHRNCVNMHQFDGLQGRLGPPKPHDCRHSLDSV
jgi:hypothetical protein